MTLLLQHDPEKARPGLDPGWVPVSRLREASAVLRHSHLSAPAGEGRSENIMLKLTLAAVLLGARCEPNCGPDLAAGFIGEWPFAYNAQL
jgi:hypothetical protein